MSSGVVSVAVLLLLVCAPSSAANLRLVSRRFPPPCCVTVSHDNITGDVIGDTYRTQAANSPCVKAIILTSRHGPVCVNPNANWVKKVIANMSKI